MNIGGITAAGLGTSGAQAVWRLKVKPLSPWQGRTEGGLPRQIPEKPTSWTAPTKN